MNVCSQAGILTGRYSDEIIAKLTSPTVTVADIDKFASDYIQLIIITQLCYFLIMWLIYGNEMNHHKPVPWGILLI